MFPFAYYILKVIICSTVLYGYYWFFLRNKVFHSYNRFYLLAAIVLSLTLPLLKFNVWQKADSPKASVVHMLQVVNNSDEYMDEIIIQSHYNHISKEEIAMWIFLAICIVFGWIFTSTIFRIYSLKKNNRCHHYDGITLVHTDDKRTPFSFLKNIFWNDEIDINSSNGKRILKHEVAHVQEKHSHDKLFINIMLIFFWCNPIFWFIRRELNMIHEFIADKKAVEDGDTGAFAAMILQATYPGHRFELTNNFFYSPIKRRLSMLTKNKTKMGYISRLLVLPLALVVFAAFTLRAKTYIASLPNDKIYTVVIDAGHGGTDNGAVSEEGIFEKDLALKYALEIKALNKNEHVRIILARETDVYQTPQEKAAFGNRAGADLFISLHFNNVPDANQTKSGMEIWVSKSQYSNNEKSELLASSIINSFRNNYGLAVPEAAQRRTRGIWVLQESKCPAVLIEAGYMSNKKDLAYLESADCKEQFAKNILTAISNFVTSKQTGITPVKMGVDTVTPKPVKTIVQPINNNKTSFSNGKISFGGSGWNEQRVMIIINGKIYTDNELINKTVTCEHGTGYTKNDPEMVKKYGKKAANGVLILENAHIEDSPEKEMLTNNPGGALAVRTNQPIKVDTTAYAYIDGSDEARLKKLIETPADEQGHAPIFFLNGKQTGQQTLKEMGNTRIEYAKILFSASAMEKYGEKGKYGAVEIVLKKDPRIVVSNSTSVRRDITEIKNISTFNCDDPDYKIVSATVFFSGKGFPKVERVQVNDESLKSCEKYLNAMVDGSVMTFDQVRIAKKDGTGLMAIEGISIQFYDQLGSSKNVDGGERLIEKNIHLSLSGIAEPAIPINRLKEIKQLKCDDPFYKITYATVYFSGEGFPEVVQTSIYDGSLVSLENYMKKIVAGSRITFDNVFISKKNGGDKVEIAGRSFGFYDKNPVQANKDSAPGKVFTKVEQEPEFPGGKEGWQVYLQKNIDPKTPVDEGWKPGTYTIVVNFVVDKEGNVSAVSSDDYINSKTAQQCISLITNGPKWIPAKQNGKIVSAYRKQPITFVVSEN